MPPINEQGVFTLLRRQLGKLTDLNTLYQEATILQKQQLIKQGFDRQLYFQDEVV